MTTAHDHVRVRARAHVHVQVPGTDDVVFDRARAALHADDPETAARLLDRIGEDSTKGDVERQLYVQWTHLPKTATPHELNAIVELARRAHKANQAPGFATYVIGVAALRRGDQRAALRLFRAASQQDPELIDAKRQRRLLERRLATTKQRSPMEKLGESLKKILPALPWIAGTFAFLLVVALVSHSAMH